MNNTFHSNGKLLITGEYVVLDGAMALAIPTKYGQSLVIESSERAGIHWRSLDEKGEVWFEEDFDIDEFQPKDPGNKYSKTLSEILAGVKKLNPGFLSGIRGVQVKTKLDFPQHWGLGSSSTLINNISRWGKVDPFSLLDNSFGGSGYDIAAAQRDFPILYSIEQGSPRFQGVQLCWNFTGSLFFVHLNQKQDSKEGIIRYRKKGGDRSVIQRVSEISVALPLCETVLEFENLISEHELLVSKTIGLPPIKEKFFSDYPHGIKSLGAWGGDFILAIGDKDDIKYFTKKGFHTVIPFDQMIK